MPQNADLALGRSSVCLGTLRKEKQSIAKPTYPWQGLTSRLAAAARRGAAACVVAASPGSHVLCFHRLWSPHVPEAASSALEESFLVLHHTDLFSIPHFIFPGRSFLSLGLGKEKLCSLCAARGALNWHHLHTEKHLWKSNQFWSLLSSIIKHWISMYFSSF